MLKGSCIASYKWTNSFWKLLSQFKWGSEVNSTFKIRFSSTFNVAISQISSWTAIKATRFFKMNIVFSFSHRGIWTDCHTIDIPFSDVVFLAYVIHIEIIYAWWQHFSIVFKTDCVSSPLYRIDSKNKWLYRAGHYYTTWTTCYKAVWRLTVSLPGMCLIGEVKSPARICNGSQSSCLNPS